mmetsp:Transcript_27688/g.87539  ORF Transcript_27688/g.87539 Transcript_27688/m.87539 type:complete len:329 (+) Transcript_27688:28-1014(+)
MAACADSSARLAQCMHAREQTPAWECALRKAFGCGPLARPMPSEHGPTARGHHGHSFAPAQVSTSSRKRAMPVSEPRPRTKSTSFLPVLACTACASSSARSRKPPIASKSSALQPRVVMAQLPRRTPPGEAGDMSPGRELRLSTREAHSQTFSILEPLKPAGRRSHNSRWLSEPPVATVRPFLARKAASARELSMTSAQYWRKAGVATSLSCTASAPIVALCGPPCKAGKTAPSTAPCSSRLQKMRPPRGPRRLLCVVLVTTSACGKGDGCRPVATRPLMCAMSTSKYAPTSSQMLRNSPQSMIRGYAEAPAMIIRGRNWRAKRRSSP